MQYAVALKARCTPGNGAEADSAKAHSLFAAKLNGVARTIATA